MNDYQDYQEIGNSTFLGCCWYHSDFGESHK